MYNVNKMKRAAKRKRDAAIRECKRTKGHKGDKKIRKKEKFDEREAA